jgi:hypothetical protein
MKQHFLRAVILLGVATTIACGGQPETIEQRCERVRDRLVALELRHDDPQREVHARVMRRAMGDAFLARCARNLTHRQRECVFASSDAKTAFACVARVATSTDRDAARRVP